MVARTLRFTCIKPKNVWLLLVLLLCFFGLFIWIRHRGQSDEARSHHTDELTIVVVDQLNPPQTLYEHQSLWKQSDQPELHSLECDKWAVVAPGDSQWASEAVRRQVRLRHWCVVIVFEKRPSVNYNPGWYQERDCKAVVYLTEDDVNTKNIGVPWNDIGRKIFGYLYAMSHGAKVIWDFNDHNMLKFWIPGAAPKGAPSVETTIPITESIAVRELQGHRWLTYNPNVALGAQSLPSWPRGLPVDDSVREECSKGELKESQLQSHLLAVLQSPSDHQPDADIIYQSTMLFPFSFNRTRETRPLLVPPHTFAPYNAKATLHFQPGLWALYLPITVDKELSDIWRGYIAQRLFWEAGLRVGYTARPLVVQDHDIRITKQLSQSYLKASNKTKQLLTFLCTWRGKEDTFVNRIEELWTALYHNKFIDKSDVEATHLWLRILKKMNYSFPELKEASISCYVYPEHAKWSIPSFSDKEAERYTTRRNELEYSDKVCHTSKSSLTFWNSDTHYGTRLDMSSFLGSLGHNVYETIGQRNDRHPEVWKLPGVHLYDKISSVIKRDFPDFHGMNSRLKESMTRENFEFYKNDPQIRSVDAFYCLFPASLCEMWMPFNKSIIVIPAHRYNMGRCTKEEFDRLNEHLHMLASSESPRHIMAATSKYDMEYLRHYTGIRDVLPLYAYSGCYVDKYKYAPKRDEIPMFMRSPDYMDRRFKTEIKKFKIVDVRSLYRDFLFSNFVQHRAAVYFPYASMSFKMVELYRMGVPLFFPSMKYLRTFMGIGADRSILAKYYCERTGLGLKDSEMIPHPNSINPYSPNLQEHEDKEAEYYWLQYADFFQWPHLTYFDDFKDLERKLEEADFDKIHKLMMEENERFTNRLTNNWCKVFNKIEKGRKVPQDYDHAINELYGVTRLQVY